MTSKTPLFSLGQVLATPTAIAVITRLQVNPAELLSRHITGDWGNVPPEDKQANEAALQNEARLLSSYQFNRKGEPITRDEAEHSTVETIWIITEADRSVTTLLLPEDY